MLIMLKLINIKRDKNFIEAEYLPEISNDPVYIKIDVNTGDIIESRHSKYEEPYEDVSECRIMAATELEKLISNETLPEEKIIMWY